jgi:tetratricopeptide (TPR) repeat protein
MERKRKRYHSAVHYWRTAHERFGELSETEPFIQSQILMNLGTVYQELGDYAEARSYLKQAYELLKGTDDVEKIANAYLNLGLSYLEIKAYEHASEYLRYAIAIFESTNNTKAAIQSKRRYGFVLGEEGRFDEAMQLLFECLEEFNDHQYPLEVASVHNEIAKLYLRQEKFEESAKECIDALNKTQQDMVETAHLMRTLAQAEAGVGNLNAGIEAAEKALDLFRGHQLLGEVSETYSLLGDFYEKIGDFAKATECLREMKQTLNDNLKAYGIVL